MTEYIDILAILLVARGLFLIVASRHLTWLKRRSSTVNRYIKTNYTPWVYRLLGLSVLWLIIQYKDLLRSLI